MLVRLLERLRDLERDDGGLLHRDGAALDAIGERVTGHQLHHQRGGALALLEAVDRRDVRMVERGEDLRLAREARHVVGVVGERRGQHLERDVAMELRVVGAVDLAHAAHSEAVGDFVVSD